MNDAPYKKYGTAQGRWAGFGPYYAMFPVTFAQKVVSDYCPKDGAVLDPFCGRGTVPFVAQANGKFSLGIDSNPVAWIFAKAKTEPCTYHSLIRRLYDVKKDIKMADGKPQNEFQKWAWSPDVLRFLAAARRNLDWKNRKVDRTLMGFILANVHAKIGEGLSNQMQKSRSMGPDYAVRWWKAQQMSPPNINPFDIMEKRINWRYRHGIVNINVEAQSKIALGEAESKLGKEQHNQFDLLFTSPPYMGITSYRHDSWIRLWAIGEGPALPDWDKDKKLYCKANYENMLETVFSKSKNLLKPNGIIWIRTDARKYTRDVTQKILKTVWAEKVLYKQCNKPKHKTQTAHFGDLSQKPGEIDFLAVNPNTKLQLNSFKPA